jgi:hypothetical protein
MSPSNIQHSLFDRGSLSRAARGARVEADDREHLAADFEDEVFLP